MRPMLYSIVERCLLYGALVLFISSVVHSDSSDVIVQSRNLFQVFGEMNMPGIDEGVKQALMKRTGFKGVSNTVRRSRSLSVSSVASSAGGGGRNRKAPLRRTSSNRLDIPV